MFKKSLYLIIILCFLFVGCSKNDNLQEKIEISILDGYIVTQVSIPENNKTALVTLSKDGSLINSNPDYGSEEDLKNLINIIKKLEKKLKKLLLNGLI